MVMMMIAINFHFEFMFYGHAKLLLSIILFYF